MVLFVKGWHAQFSRCAFRMVMVGQNAPRQRAHSLSPRVAGCGRMLACGGSVPKECQMPHLDDGRHLLQGPCVAGEAEHDQSPQRLRTGLPCAAPHSGFYDGLSKAETACGCAAAST